MVGGGDPFYLKFWSRWNKIADFEPIFAPSASAVTLAKKVQLTLIGNPLRDYRNKPIQISLPFVTKSGRESHN